MNLKIVGHLLCLVGLIFPSALAQSTPIRLAPQDAPITTDWTGHIRSFFDFGNGFRGAKPPLICYTAIGFDVHFTTPTGSMVELRSPLVFGGDAPLSSRPWTYNRIRMPGDDGDALLITRTSEYWSPNGEYCCRLNTNPTVRRCLIFTNCISLPPVTNGVITYNRHTNKATYSCNAGYLLSGTSPITCNAGRPGPWSASPPTCQATCPDLTLANGRVTYNPPSSPRLEGALATHSCNTGYILSDKAVRTCQKDRTWSGGVTSCKVTCPNFAPLANGLIMYSDPFAPRGSGSMATFRCNTGYRLNTTNSSSICSLTGWSLSPEGPRSCELSCPDLTIPANGNPVIYSNNSNPRAAGSTATYSCLSGYELVGNTMRTCTASRWDGSDPVCTGQCLHLPPLENGQISYLIKTESTNDSVYLEDTEAKYSCDEDNVLIGQSTRTCQSDASWSPDAPYCTDQALVQFKFGLTDYCRYWTESKVSLMRTTMRGAVQEAILIVGNHTLPLEHISEGVFSCYGNRNHTIYRTTITGTGEISAEQSVKNIQKWLESGAAVQVEWYLLYFDKTCPARISHLGAEECGG